MIGRRASNGVLRCGFYFASSSLRFALNQFGDIAFPSAVFTQATIFIHYTIFNFVVRLLNLVAAALWATDKFIPAHLVSFSSGPPAVTVLTHNPQPALTHGVEKVMYHVEFLDEGINIIVGLIRFIYYLTAQITFEFHDYSLQASPHASHL